MTVMENVRKRQDQTAHVKSKEIGCGMTVMENTRNKNGQIARVKNKEARCGTFCCFIAGSILNIPTFTVPARFCDHGHTHG